MADRTKVLPKIELPAQQDYLEAEKFHDFKSRVYSDAERQTISDTAWKIFLARKEKQ